MVAAAPYLGGGREPRLQPAARAALENHLSIEPDVDQDAAEDGTRYVGRCSGTAATIAVGVAAKVAVAAKGGVRNEDAFEGGANFYDAGNGEGEVECVTEETIPADV